jgi:hypothetical protein
MARLSDESQEYILRAQAGCDLGLAYEREYPGIRHVQVWKVESCRY